MALTSEAAPESVYHEAVRAELEEERAVAVQRWHSFADWALLEPQRRIGAEQSHRAGVVTMRRVVHGWNTAARRLTRSLGWGPQEVMARDIVCRGGWEMVGGGGGSVFAPSPWGQQRAVCRWVVE